MNIRSWSRARIAAMAVASLLLPAPGAFIAQAQPAANAQTRASIETDLVEVQALDRLIDYYRVSLREPGEALAPLRNSKGGIDIDASWRKAVDGVFAAGGFARKLAQHQAAALSEAEAREIVSFRRSSLGGKLTAAEVTSPFPLRSSATRPICWASSTSRGVRSARTRSAPRSWRTCCRRPAAGPCRRS